MAGPERIEWRRAFPSRALVALVWYVVLAGVVLGPAWMLFGDEPALLDDGRPNSLTVVTPLTAALAFVCCVPLVLTLVRRPLVAAVIPLIARDADG
jgi:hypothetical protein